MITNGLPASVRHNTFRLEPNDRNSETVEDKGYGRQRQKSVHGGIPKDRGGLSAFRAWLPAGRTG
jgi:hypothetical protein